MNENTRICKVCKKEKPISEFKKARNYNISKSGEKRYYYYWRDCNDCVKKRISLLSTKYKHHKKVYHIPGEVNWRGVYRSLRKGANQRKIDIKFSLRDFNAWVKKQPDNCTYCGLSVKKSQEIILKYFKKGSMAKSLRFQVDRKNNNIGYTIDNICFACAICNSHKADFYSHNEFLEIASKYIKPKLKSL